MVLRYVTRLAAPGAAALVAQCGVERRSGCDAAPREAPALRLQRKLTPVGRFSLLSETAANPSIPAVLLKLVGPPLYEAELAAALEKGFVKTSDRFSSVVDDATLTFLPLTTFNAKDAVTRVDANSINVAAEIVAPLDPSRPRWNAKMWHPQSDETMVLLRAHHALADGVSLAALFGKCTDQADQLDALVAGEVKKFRKRSFLERLVRGLAFFFLVVRAALDHLVTNWRCRILVRGGQSRSRSVAWASDFSDVETLKRVAKALGGPRATVNDVYAAVVAGALGRCLVNEETGTFCAALPVHLFGGALPPGQEVGNHIGAVLVPLPLTKRDGDGDDARAHVRACSEALRGSMRGGAAAVFAYMAAYAAGALLPRSVVPAAMAASTRNVSVAMTNVRGPPLDLAICGRRVTQSVPFLPPPPGVAIGTALMTMGGFATLSINAQADVVDAGELLAHALAYYDDLVAAADRCT
ncbi:hypothetical protein M885DRAFT_610145 [Pelagophyceae sp. CCMP2097]|nr:hypothetical protein M885DRAFT_610145 [Pelagophyceae sp. CCMP2097]